MRWSFKNIDRAQKIMERKCKKLPSAVHRFGAVILLHWLVLATSLTISSLAFSQGLGFNEKPTDWDLKAIRAQGDRFFLETYADDDPRKAGIERTLEKGTFKLKLGDFSDAEILSLCDYREILRRNNKNIKPCPLIPSLGVVGNSVRASQAMSVLEKIDKGIPRKGGKRGGLRLMEDEEPTPLLWNAWAEESPAPSEKPLFKPVTHLRPEHDYLLTLDLSAISYDKNVKGTYTQPAATAFRDLVNQWKNLDDDVSLTMVILPDSTYFESEKPSDVMKVDLKKIKEYDKKGLPSPNQDPFTILAREKGKNQNFVFGRVAFRVKTKLLVGETESLAPISFSIWVNNIPVDEISVRWCIASTEALPTTCQGIGPSQFGLRGGDSLAVASETSRSPNAALTFVEVGPKKVYGVFWRSDKPGYFSWLIKENAEQLTKTLVNQGNAFVKSRDDENELLKRGGGLYNTLFPEKKARQAFESYLKPILQKDPSMDTYKAPSIFVRMVQYGEGTTLRIPLGMMAVRLDDGPSEKAKFLGFYFRIETPLERQSYQVSSNCLSDWIMVFPELNVPDDPLKKAIGRVKNRIPAWRAEAREKFEDIRKFGDWIAETNPVVQTALMVLSHHAEDRLTFEPANLVHAKEALREFQRPSVAILSGCATATPGSGAVGFVSQFNQRGIDTVIATSTEVDAYMAGDFLDTLATVVKDKEGDANFSIADAYFKTLQELKIKVPPDGTRAYGSRVLEYNLLGNGNIRLCSPKKR